MRPEYDNTVMIGQTAKSLVVVPMIAGGEVNGVISLQNLDQEDAFLNRMSAYLQLWPIV